MKQHIEDFIWDSFDELHPLFPLKVAQRLREQKNSNKRLDFSDDLTLIFSMDDTIVEKITKEYRQKLEGVKTIEDMIALLEKYPYSQEYLTKAQAWIEEDKVSETMGNLLNTIGYTYYLQGDYSKALEFYQKSLAIYEEVLGTKHPSTVTSYDNIGMVYQAKREYDKALEFYQKSLATYEEVLGIKHHNTAASYNNIGGVYYAKEKYDKALEFYQKSRAIYEEVLGTKHHNTAASYNNIGLVYKFKGEYDKALEFYQKSLATYEEVLGIKHPNTATSYDNIGMVYQAKGEYDKALEFYQKSLAIHEEVLGIKHPSTVQSYNNIGMVYYAKEKYDEALELYKKSRAIYEEVLGIKHPDTAKSYNDIGIVYQAKGEHNEALKYHQKALAIREKVLGLEHPDTAANYNNIGMVYYAKEKYDKALEFYQKSRAIYEEVLGTKHPDTAKSYDNIGMVYQAKREYDEALEFYKKSRAIYEEVLGIKHPDTAKSYNNIGMVYQAKREYDEALEFYKKSRAIYEEVLGIKHPDTATSYNNIGGVYYAKEEYDKALEFCQKALKININTYNTAHKNSELFYNNIIAFKNNFFINSSHLNKALYLDRVYIENFKLLKDFKMHFTKGVNIIIGENSSGKTSLLQSITLGLMKKGSLDDFNDFEKYITKTKSESKINLYFDGYEKHTTLKSNAREVDNNVLSPFVVAYGSNIFTKYKLEADEIVNNMLSGNIRRDFTTSIFQDYTDKIHNPKSILNKLSELARNGNERAKKYEVIFQNTINDFIEGFDLIKDEQSKQYIFKCTEGNHFRLENLSEGYRNSVLLIGDILVKVLGVRKKPDTIEGVILIDEFDRHLHPKWQSNLVTKLTTIFPKIQFILTTHNPMSVLGREANEITIIKEEDGELKAIKKSGTKNIDAGTVLVKYFGVNLVSNVMHDNLKLFTQLKLKNQELSEEETKEFAKLEEDLSETVATNFIYNNGYFKFLKFAKTHQDIDFDELDELSEEELDRLLSDFEESL